MIKTLKRKFILLAMVSLTVLLAVIVTGMNIINYNKVVGDADSRLEVLEQNSERLLRRPDGFGAGSGISGGPGQPDGSEASSDSSAAADTEDNGTAKDREGDNGEFYFGRDGRGGPRMTMDEAEEARFFTVKTDGDGNVVTTNIDRIYSVDSGEAEEYAEKALDSGRENGFADEFRYSVDESGTFTTITFLDCGRTLEAFRAFLRASILMSVCGLLIMFAVISYFASRIVSPVAESYEKQKRFITDAGHEIKTPLAIIKANLDVIKLDPDSAEECLEEIGNQTDRLTGLTNDLVYLSRMEESDKSLVMSDVDLSELVRRTVNSFIPLAAEKGKMINDEIEEGVTVKGSRKELEKLLSIVMENAVKYSAVRKEDLQNAAGGSPDAGGTARTDDEDFEPPIPQIDVSLRREGRNAVIEVRNAAENELTNESLSHVFERFYRTDSSRNSQTGGHGIGLSMANAIVSAHDGKIAARTTDGYDFIVTASLPVQ